MASLKRMGMVLGVVAALGIPSAASAFSLMDWLRDLFKPRTERPHWPYTRPNPSPSVPEPTAALLFGVGAALVAARARKSR